MTIKKDPVSKPNKSSTATCSCEAEKKTTKIIIKYDAGFGNALYIRGSSRGLSWDKGIPLKNIGKDEWVWETNELFSPGEFKVLLNDQTYETGYNHPIHQGKSIYYTPKF